MDFVRPLLNLDFFGYFNIIFSRDFVLNRGSPKILYFGYFSIKMDPIFHYSCLFVISYFFTSCAY
jgi:hypothetical protein